MQCTFDCCLSGGVVVASSQPWGTLATVTDGHQKQALCMFCTKLWKELLLPCWCISASASQAWCSTCAKHCVCLESVECAFKCCEDKNWRLQWTL